MADGRLEEMMQPYEDYVNRYGRDDIERMLEEDESENGEEIPNAAGMEPLEEQDESVNRNISSEEVMNNV